MNADRLTFQAPRSDAARELNSLVDRRTALAEELRQAEVASRIAPAERLRTSEELSALIGRRAGGEAGLDAAITKAEKALAKYKAEAAAPWPERITGLRQAVRSAEGDVARFVGEHYDELSAEIADDAVAVKERADAVLAEVLAVYREREAVVGRFNALIGAAGIRVVPGMVPWSKLEAVAKAAEEVLLGDGEVVPAPARDPRVPRSGAVIADMDAEEAWT